ncbi:MAG: hypothetical protein ACR2MP_33525 [Streptosporangiaceae bacterium]
MVKPLHERHAAQVTDDAGTMTSAGTQTAPDRRAALGPRRAAGAVTGLQAAILLAALAGAALTIVAAGGLARGDLVSQLGETAAAAAYAMLGALIVRRAGNVIGWIMLGEGAASAFLALASICYRRAGRPVPRAGTAGHPGSVVRRPGGRGRLHAGSGGCSARCAGGCSAWWTGGSTGPAMTRRRPWRSSRRNCKTRLTCGTPISLGQAKAPAVWETEVPKWEDRGLARFPHTLVRAATLI